MLRRRSVLVATSIPVSAALAMDPVTLTILTSLISAGAAIFSGRAAALVAAEAQREALQMQWALEREKLSAAGYRMPAYPMGNSLVRQQTAVGRDGAPMTAGWTDDLDGFGTYAGVSGGRIGLQRGVQYGGVVSAAEAERFAEGLQYGEPAAIPVEGGYHTYSARDAAQLQASLGRNWRGGDSLVGGRRFSRAQTPTANGWDTESVIVSNPTGEVRALAVSRNALRG